ncbi:SDR family NAD(P)-dependent oxidoreductase [Rhizobiaceae bacterium]|nr:SDR family NAD(P)-dependent oxidoreductase [Rhizobiaceae bacterium]
MRALVTGAAEGLGRALTDALLAAGHDVVTVDRNTADLERLAIATRGACSVLKADLANPHALARLLTQLDGDPFDLVLLNAGISAAGRFEDIPRDAYKPVIDVNVTAPLTIAAALVRDGRMATKSRMVFVSSLSHVTGYPGAAVYAASKDALTVWARSARKPFHKAGVGITIVFPGPIKTAHANRYAPEGASAAKRTDPVKLAPLILKAARKGRAEFYPGGRLARTVATFAPGLLLRGLRRALYDKLDKPRL